MSAEFDAAIAELEAIGALEEIGGAVMDEIGGWVLLHEVDGAWEVVAVCARPDAPQTAAAAVNEILAEHAAGDEEPPAGRWVAIPAAHWKPAQLRLRHYYELVEAGE